MTRVLIRGDGVAARTSAHLLDKAGYVATLEPASRARLPAVMLMDSALALLRDVFSQPDLFHDAPRIQRRIVAWGAEERPRAFDHSAVVVSEEALLQSLKSAAHPEGTGGQYNWTICSSKPLPSPTVEHRFGSRRAAAARVVTRNCSRPDACWTESHEGGWLFLIPSSADSAWLLSAGSPVEEGLAQSRLIAKQVDAIVESHGEFFAAPRILSPLTGASWVACGTAAMGFDPLCGDGTAHAVREAILASAVIRSAVEGGAADDLLALYESRLISGFRRHLVQCHHFYRTGHSGAWWQQELNALERGLEWCTRKLHPQRPLNYRLNGFQLEAIA
jgi:hypothetical protein